MKHLPVDQTTINRGHRDRLRLLERDNTGNQRPQQEELAVFSYSGTVIVSVSCPYFVHVGGQLTAVKIAVGTAGSGSSTFKVRQDGTVIGSTITLPSSTTTVIGYIGDYRIPNGSLLTLEAVTVGSGLADLGATIVMKG